MNNIMIVIPIALAFTGLLLWLIRPRQHSVERGGASVHQKMEGALPKHYQFFPQIRQALSAIDERYLREVAPPEIAQQAFRERRAVARKFLHGLHEDFSGLERLARTIALLSPVISRQQETERILLSLRFRLFYGLVWLRLSTGRVPLLQIEELTKLIGRLALRMEQAMTEISALSADSLPRGVSV